MAEVSNSWEIFPDSGPQLIMKVGKIGSRASRGHPFTECKFRSIVCFWLALYPGARCPFVDEGVCYDIEGKDGKDTVDVND